MTEVGPRPGSQRRHRTCMVCGSSGTFIAPKGMLCEKHAAEVLTKREAGSEDSWVPIRMERPDGARRRDSKGESDG